MTFEEFTRRANIVFEEIPAQYKEGIDGLEVLPKIVYHPELDGIYTIGECLSETYPSEFGGAGAIRSRVVLYYGSFVQISREDDDWDWEEEIYETITHEIRHHLEHLASDEALEEMDYAEDQNFARLEGADFEPYFYRSGEPAGDGSYLVGDEIFVEVSVSGEVAAGSRIEARCRDLRLSFDIPDPLGDVHFVDIPEECRGRRPPVTVVLLRQQGFWDSLKSAVGTRRVEVLSSEAAGCRAAS